MNLESQYTGKGDKEGETNQPRIYLELLMTLFLHKRYGGFTNVTNVEKYLHRNRTHSASTLRKILAYTG